MLLKENGMNDVIYAIVTYENGAIACMEACWTLPENSPTIIDDKVELVATKGVAYVDACDNGVRFVTEKGVQSQFQTLVLRKWRGVRRAGRKKLWLL